MAGVKIFHQLGLGWLVFMNLHLSFATGQDDWILQQSQLLQQPQQPVFVPGGLAGWDPYSSKQFSQLVPYMTTTTSGQQTTFPQVPQQIGIPSTQSWQQNMGSAAQASPATAAPAASSSDVLDLHNKYRATHHTSPLGWSDDLARSAQSWADNLAASCSFGHSRTGENLASGFSSWQDVTYAWYSEIQYYNYGNPGYSSATGHATQMLWKSTTQVGCAVAQSRGSCNQGQVHVCHYDPPGNVNTQEQFAANVQAA